MCLQQGNIVHPPFTMSSSGKNSICRICGGVLMGNQRRWLFGRQNKNGHPQTPTEATRRHNQSRSLQNSPWGESKTFPFSVHTLCLLKHLTCFFFFFWTRHRKYVIAGVSRISVQVPVVPELSVQGRWFALRVDPHPGTGCATGEHPGGICVRQMRLPPWAGVQIWLCDSEGQAAFIREAAEDGAGAKQDQTMGAQKLLPETPSGLSELGQHQWRGWGVGEGGLQGNAQRKYGTLGVWVLVRKVGHMSIFYKDR